MRATTPARVRKSADPRARLCVKCYHRWFPVDGWEPPGGVDALLARVPVELRPAVLVVAFDVCRVAVAGPAAHLCVPDIDDGGQIAAALVDAGLIDLYETTSGVVRWARTGHEGAAA